jgi:anti-sigma regulatory factor (Ser/Thr protein kinase)
MSPSASDRDDFLMKEARRVTADLEASSVTVYLLERGGAALRAAVVVVRLLGIGSLERIPLGDDVYASALAYRTGRVETAYSSDEIGLHPEFAVFATFPFTVSSVPLSCEKGLYGVLAVYWPNARQVTKPEQERQMREAADRMAAGLATRAAGGVSMTAPVAPLVVPPAEGDGAEGETSPSGTSAPLLYHLQKLTVALNGTWHVKEAVQLVMQRVTASFSARAIAVTMVEGGRLRLVGATGCSKDLRRALNGRPLTEPSPETRAVAGAKQVRFDTQAELARSFPKLTGYTEDIWVVLPLTTRGRVIGTCSLGFASGSQGVLLDPAVLTALGTLLGQTLDRTQLGDAQHRLARKLQEALLPRTLPQMAGIRSTTRYVTGSRGVELGGDWYDVVSLPDGGVGAVVGDVQGHNVTAAVVMGQLRSVVRAYAAEGHDPAEVLERTNRLLVDLDTERFATCCLVWLLPETGLVTIATAGHHLPVIRGPSGAQPVQGEEIGVPLGIDSAARYTNTRLRLEPGTLMALYTDGLATARDDAADAVFGELARDPEGELEALGDRLIAGAAGAEQADDAALLLLRYEGSGTSAGCAVRRLAIDRRDLQGVRRTRAFVRDWLRARDLELVGDEMELLASEVVTNALVHGDSDVDVHVRRYPDRVRVEVRDSDPSPALPVAVGSGYGASQAEEAEGGRGLVIVSLLASAWGNSPSGRGKTVWFELPIVPREVDLDLAAAGESNGADPDRQSGREHTAEPSPEGEPAAGP